MFKKEKRVTPVVLKLFTQNIVIHLFSYFCEMLYSISRLINIVKPYAVFILIAYTITLLTVSSLPSVPTLKLNTGRKEIRLDYLIHFAEYGILAFLAFLAFADNNLKITNRKYILLTLGLILFAIADEFHQKLIPGRSFNNLDMASNIAGIIVSLVVTIVIFRNLRSINSLNPPNLSTP